MLDSDDMGTGLGSAAAKLPMMDGLSDVLLSVLGVLPVHHEVASTQICTCDMLAISFQGGVADYRQREKRGRRQSDSMGET